MALCNVDSKLGGSETLQNGNDVLDVLINTIRGDDNIIHENIGEEAARVQDFYHCLLKMGRKDFHTIGTTSKVVLNSLPGKP